VVMSGGLHGLQGNQKGGMGQVRVWLCGGQPCLVTVCAGSVLQSVPLAACVRYLAARAPVVL
jgi:hypothetical protein